MAQENTISVNFSTEEIKKVKDAISTIASVLEGKVKSLTPTERQGFGRVKYEKEVWIDRVKLQLDANPTKVPAYVDKTEFDQDYAAHKQLNELINLLDQQLQLMKDTNLLLGYDLDGAALMFYRAIKVAATNNDPGAGIIYTDLKQQYPGERAKAPLLSPPNRLTNPSNSPCLL
ncbi:hypothetical protein N4241_11040 [Riemerella anatipestifer]|uniref:hypothetical protein n=1 Tax=Riemerella anatipestifer TaxID=34085 RepID=UPI0021D5F34C|nr:hypothetical protein [Riemerella anatipestifer]MCU7571637.1 hypothetical protein [Riemerella anatipestifer]